MRARELGIEIGTGTPGPRNAITDVEGVRVGYTTLIEGDDVRTGVTVVVPPEVPLFAAPHRLNGNGELTGLEWVRESGMLTTTVAITNTHSVGVVHDALIQAVVEGGLGDDSWSLPVVGETWDGLLNDINGMHVRPEHVFAALQSAAAGPVAEGNVGGGTGMICHGFKGGTGSSSRVLKEEEGGYTVGVLVQANHGSRERLAVDGIRSEETCRRTGSRFPVPTRPRARSSASSRRTRRSSLASAGASRSGPGSAWRARAGPARTRAETSSSPPRQGIGI